LPDRGLQLAAKAAPVRGSRGGARAGTRSLLVLAGFARVALACNATGTEPAQPGDAGADGTTSPTSTGSPSDGGSSESAVEASLASTCLDLDAGILSASVDCVYGGHCPVSCASGTASAYLCRAAADASATYPAELDPPSDGVDVIAWQPDAYPWDGGAYLSCAPLTCTRWATGDHANGGSAWSGDPCAEGGAATEAWACPTFPGVLPTPAGCFTWSGAARVRDRSQGAMAGTKRAAMGRPRRSPEGGGSTSTSTSTPTPTSTSTSTPTPTLFEREPGPSA
jgi:hypothetical protein